MTSMTEKEYYQLSVSVSKALNMMEAPLKLKHARSVIITTHRTKESKSFWAIISTQPLMENRFTAWKFCHLLHKVLREGHHSAIKQSQSHKSMLTEMGKLWGHLKDGVGNCIQAYCKLLVTKLDFHDKNGFLPGSLSVPFMHIENFAGDDINVYFQLGVEIFDYLEDIIAVQENVFRSVDAYRMSSMSPQGQCRLAPLITLIQDSNPLYDCCVRIMFKLHHNLPNDVLIGHRDRFREMFGKLKLFYDKVRPLQYFADLIQVPILPETAPNFTSKVDFGNYIPPVVTVPEPEEPEPVTEDLVNLSVSNDNYAARESAEYKETITNYEQAIQAKEMALENLEYQLQSLKSSYTTMEERYQQEIIELRNEVRQLHDELKSSHEAYSKVENVKHDLELQVVNSSTLSQKAVELEEKAKISDEKFLKLKTMYSDMREEHIKLLRQNGETKKQLNQEKQLNDTLKAEQVAVIKELEELREKSAISGSEKSDLERLLEEKSNQIKQLGKECDELRNEISSFKSAETLKSTEIAKTREELMENVKELEITKARTTDLEGTLAETKALLTKMRTEHEGTIAQLNANLKAKESYIDDLKGTHLEALGKITAERDDTLQKLNSLTSSLHSKQNDYEELSQKKLLADDEIAKTREELMENVKELEITKARTTDLEGTLAETKALLTKMRTEHAGTIAQLNANLKAKESYIDDLKGTHLEALGKITAERDDTLQKLNSLTSRLHSKQNDYEELSQKKLLADEKLKELQVNNATLETKCAEVISEIKLVQSEKAACETNSKHVISSLLDNVFLTTKSIISLNFNENGQQRFERSFQILEEVQKLLVDLKGAYREYSEGSNHEKLVQSLLLLCYQICMLREQCMLVYNTTTDIEKGQKIFDMLLSLAEPIELVFTGVQSKETCQVMESRIVSLKTQLNDLESLLRGLTKQLDSNAELGDIIESELAEMEKAIAEAAEKFVELLSHTRSNDDGIKLEVNEKILDACTNLMECIKRLIKQSKILQDEIVSTGRGRISAKEFYKRNSEWTEGLISASKSVAKGANFLVDAANKAIGSNSTQNFEIIVAAQEIAACTAQLVISSKVKAPKGSEKLQDLTKASRMVSQATGAVVAIVKDSNQRLENYTDVDLSKLTTSQAKTMEMDIHVRVLELEQALQLERLKLSAFRRNMYQNSEN